MFALQKHWSISSQILTEEAEKLGLTPEIIDQDKNLFYVRGNGKEILFKSVDFGGNSSLAYKLVNDKGLTYTLLERNNFPIAKSYYLKREDVGAFNEGNIAHLRYPLIIKPLDEGHGNGVMMNILTFQELQEKLNTSFEKYDTMIIQEQISGDEFRILVLFSEVIICINRVPATIVGNGKDTIEQRIKEENRNNPLRGEGYDAPLAYIPIDEEMKSYIRKQGYTPESILDEGKRLQLRGNSNIGTGGTVVDYTDRIHPEVKQLCINAVKLFGLSLGCIDIITTDISRPLSETGGIILELGSGPGLGGDRELTSVNTGKVILEKLFFI